MLGRIIPILTQVPVEMLGTLLDLLNRLVGENGQKTWKNLKHLLRGEFEIKLPVLIRWFGTTTTPPTTEKFVPKDKFRKDSKEVKFYDFCGVFEEDFLSGNGKTERPLGEQELRYGDLIKNSLDSSILEELGGEKKAETTLTGLYDLLEKQAKGSPGVLLTNGDVNIFYIMNKRGVLCAVGVLWHSLGWLVHGSTVLSRDAWSAGYRVFSRNP